MMMPGSELVVHVWKEWGLHVLVLLSLSLQVELLILAELRRRIDCAVLRSFTWAGYLLADSTAIYVLGHLSLTNRTVEHELMAFWAPFLLLHLGGQDNITAYAMEDNQLWLRHVQAFAVQVAAAGYVLYQSSILSRNQPALLRAATILMLVVGVVKYAERVWALRCAGSIPSGNNYRTFERPEGFTIDITPYNRRRDTEALVSVAFLLLHVPVDLLIVPLSFVVVYVGISDLRSLEVYKVVEMQLSLMHEVFYTKAVVLYSLYGLCVRVISTTCTVVALSLFHSLLSSSSVDHHYRREDVAVTYVLLIGAVVLDISMALRAIFSSWTSAILTRMYSLSDRQVWAFLAGAVSCVRRLIHAALPNWRYWSGSMGQHNLREMCTHSSDSLWSRIARAIGVEDPWNVMIYSSSIRVSAFVEQLLVSQVLKSDKIPEGSPDHILNSRGQAAIKSLGPIFYEDLAAWGINNDNMELSESILVWHIATDIYLHCHKQDQDQATSDYAKAAQELSNYMLFLLAARPFMLPPPATRNTYVETCYVLTSRSDFSSVKDLADSLLEYGKGLTTKSRRNLTIVEKGCLLGAELIQRQDSPTANMPELIAQVWVEMLCYAGYRCSTFSHIKQLNNGGELITVAALLVEYIKRRNLSEETLSRPSARGT